MLNPPRSVKESFVFSRAYKKGKSVVTSHAVLYLLPRKKASGFTLGITVSKKLGKAHARTRVKRLVRESVRTLLPTEQRVWDASLIVVARARAFSPRAKMQHVRRSIEEGMKTLGLL